MVVLLLNEIRQPYYLLLTCFPFLFWSLVDTTDPVVTCQEDVSVIVIEGASGAFVDFAGAALISDNSGSASIISISPQSGSFFEVGSRSVVVIVADAAGNDANCVFQVIVSEGKKKNSSSCDHWCHHWDNS